jgi:hypothetical protein
MSAEMAMQMARVRREQIRWFLLQALNVARPAGAPTQLLRSVIQATYADATEQEVRRELDYLNDRSLVGIAKDPLDQWHCELTRLGVDVVEYTVDCQPGIARPKHTVG